MVLIITCHQAETHFDYFKISEGEIGDCVAELTVALDLS
jgi:hypothetical protein